MLINCSGNHETGSNKTFVPKLSRRFWHGLWGLGTKLLNVSSHRERWHYCCGLCGRQPLGDTLSRPPCESSVLAVKTRAPQSGSCVCTPKTRLDRCSAVMNRHGTLLDHIWVFQESETPGIWNHASSVKWPKLNISGRPPIFSPTSHINNHG